MERIAENKALQKQLGSRNLGWFFQIYLKHYLTHTTPDFHWEIYNDLERDDIDFILLNAFRDSGKSTLASLARPLHAAVTGQKKFIILCSDTHTQAKQHISNLKYELENNQTLLESFGPFKGSEEWTATSIVLANGTKIISRSRGQKVRGLRHLQHRPDLIIGDDLENSESVRTKEQRDKTEEWWIGDVWPALDKKNGYLILLGNLLHLDSLVARMKKLIEAEGIGIIKEYPLLDEDGNSVWPDRYNKKDIEDIKARNNRFFLREYLLTVVPEEGAVIKTIQYYDILPEDVKITAIAIAVDLAISKKTTADYTAINVMGAGDDGNFYNLANIAGRWSLNEGLPMIDQQWAKYKKAYPGIPLHLGFEDVAYQKAALEEYTRRFNIAPASIRPTQDKRARLSAAEPYFTSGQLKLRSKGDEDVAIEALGFGIEQHDDRIDALVMSLDLLLNQVRPDILVL